MGILEQEEDRAKWESCRAHSSVTASFLFVNVGSFKYVNLYYLIIL